MMMDACACLRRALRLLREMPVRAVGPSPRRALRLLREMPVRAVGPIPRRALRLLREMPVGPQSAQNELKLASQ